MNLACCCFLVPGRLEGTLGLSSISEVHRWLGQATLMGLVPWLLDGPRPRGAETANQGGSREARAVRAQWGRTIQRQ